MCVAADDSDTVACIYPTFEGVGNHDGGNSTDKASGLVRRACARPRCVRARERESACTPLRPIRPRGFSWL